MPAIYNGKASQSSNLSIFVIDHVWRNISHEIENCPFLRSACPRFPGAGRSPRRTNRGAKPKGSTDEPTGFYLSEATHPYKEITEAGYEVEFASPKGGKAPVDGFDLKDPVNQHFWEDATFRHGVENTLPASEVDPSRYAGIFFVGGHGAMWDLPQNTALASAAAAIYEKGGVVGAVCHGPAALINVKLSNGMYLVAGKDVAAFTNSEEAAVKLDKVIPFFLADSLVGRGAKHHSAANFDKKVVVSDRLVTGQNPASASGVGEEMAKLLNARQ